MDAEYEALVAREKALMVDIDRITAQLENAVLARKLGYTPDEKWLLRATQAGRHRKRELFKVQVRLGELRRVARRDHGKRFEATFIENARRLLDPRLFKLVLEKTINDVDGAQEKA